MTITLSAQCSLCGKPCQDGSFYLKEGTVTCTTCALLGIEPKDVEQGSEKVMPTTAKEVVQTYEGIFGYASAAVLKVLKQIEPLLVNGTMTTQTVLCVEKLVDMAERLQRIAVQAAQYQIAGDFHIEPCDCPDCAPDKEERKGPSYEP